MTSFDPDEAASLDDLAGCLRQLYTRADRPPLRGLDKQTAHVGDRLPGTGLKRVRLGRTSVSELLRGLKFPRKAFLLTFVEACGVDTGADRRWERAWDRLSPQYVNNAATELAQLLQEVDRLREELSAATRRADELQVQAQEAARLREELSAAEDRQAQAQEINRRLIARFSAAEKQRAQEVDRLREELSAATRRADELQVQAENVESGDSPYPPGTSRANQEQANAQKIASLQLYIAIRRAEIAECLLEWERKLTGSKFVSVAAPQLGEGVTEGTIARWLKREGDRVEPAEPLLEVSVGEGHFEIVSPTGGQVRAIMTHEDEIVAIGTVLAVIVEQAVPPPDPPSWPVPPPVRSWPVRMPQLGESVTEGTVTRWLKKEGERVEADEPLLEVSTDKVDTEIPSPAAGVVRDIAVGEDETVEVNTQLAVIVVTAEDEARIEEGLVSQSSAPASRAPYDNKNVLEDPVDWSMPTKPTASRWERLLIRRRPRIR